MMYTEKKYCPDWMKYYAKERARKARKERTRQVIEQIREIAETLKSTAIFYSGKFHNHQMYANVHIGGLLVRVCEITAALTFFGIVIAGLNAVAILL